MAVYETEANLTQEVAALRKKLLIALVAAVVLLAGTLAAVIRRTILNRLLALERAVRAFGRGETPKYPTAGNDELGNLVRAFQASAESRQQYRENLEREGAEKTLDLEHKNGQFEAEIAERRRVEASLRESEGLYRDLVENVHVGITRVSVEHEVLMVNPVISEIVLRPRSELIGKKCYQVFEGRDALCDPRARPPRRQ
jgi:phosphoglycerate-specific signal transduction histidine kinase